MGLITRLVDTTLFLFFLTIAISAPLLDSQTVLPTHLFPTPLIQLKQWYIRTFSDFLVRDKPYFFIGLIWVELILQWPLSLFCIYGILRNKSWLGTTCLIYGVSTFTSMVAILAEMTGSKQTSENLLKMYMPFLGAAILSILRGLTHSGKTTTAGGKHAVSRKKRV